jgi:hypothetical protein
MLGQWCRNQLKFVRTVTFSPSERDSWHACSGSNAGACRYVLAPPGIERLASHADAANHEALALRLGVVDDPTACCAWGVMACTLAGMAAGTPRDAAAALRVAIAAVAAVRVAAVVLQHSGWCLAAMRSLAAAMQSVRACARDRAGAAACRNLHFHGWRRPVAVWSSVHADQGNDSRQHAISFPVTCKHRSVAPSARAASTHPVDCPVSRPDSALS